MDGTGANQRADAGARSSIDARTTSRERLIILTSGVTRGGDLDALSLAASIDAALAAHGGVWFDDGVKAAEGASHRGRAVRFPLERLDEDLSDGDLAAHRAYAQHALWPLLHERTECLAPSARELTAHRRVVAALAQRLARALDPDDLIWVHDYALLPLGAALRRCGVTARLGFSLHAPLPAADFLTTLPGHREWLAALSAYDLVTVPTERDLASLHDYFERELRAPVRADGRVLYADRPFRALALPRSVDLAAVAGAAVRSAEPTVQRMLEGLVADRLMLGVDRLDSASGLAERLRAFSKWLAREPDASGKVALLQLAAPHGHDDDDRLARRLQGLAGRINGKHADPQWTPVRYLQRRYDLPTLAALCRRAQVGIMTPLREGMSLAAKTYVAAQDPEDPGVLVLSRFAGGARELADGAVLVNPRDLDEVARVLATANAMPRAERVRRWRYMAEALRRHDATSWREQFLAMLRAAPGPARSALATGITPRPATTAREPRPRSVLPAPVATV